MFTLKLCPQPITEPLLDIKTSVNLLCWYRSGGSVVDNTLDYLSRDCKINPLLSQVFRMRLLTQVPSPYGLVVGGTLNLEIT